MCIVIVDDGNGTVAAQHVRQGEDPGLREKSRGPDMVSKPGFPSVTTIGILVV